MMYGVKVPFLMREFSSSNIMLHDFNVDKNEGELVIVYGIIIEH